MAGEKEVRTKIASIKNTQKITRAMEMVAASKMRKALERMNAARPYADKIRNVIAHLSQARSEYHHPFTQARDPVNNVGLIVVSTDRGLCGGLNSNLFRHVVKQMRAWEQQGRQIRMCLFGQKAVGYFSRIGAGILGQTTHIGDAPSVAALIGAINIMLEAYRRQDLDELYIGSNNFVNSMAQEAEIEQLLPIQPQADQDMAHHWDYIYEPDASEVLDRLLERYIESLVYQRVVENIASEQSARMVAMKSASDNAGKLIDELQLIYNKARQAAITQELSEIVSGAAAV